MFYLFANFQSTDSLKVFLIYLIVKIMWWERIYCIQEYAVSAGTSLRYIEWNSCDSLSQCNYLSKDNDGQVFLHIYGKPYNVYFSLFLLSDTLGITK